MAKGSRGLPSHYSLNVPENLATRPVHLDDYLDEASKPRVSAPSIPPEPSPPPPSPPAPARENVIHMPAPIDSFREALRSEARPMIPERNSPIPEPRGFRPPPRKQLNMSPETLRMVEELLETIQRYSGQKDAKASEMFHALVSALYGARDKLDLQNIPARGRWGTPTARAFPIALKNAFQSAISDWHRRRRE